MAKKYYWLQLKENFFTQPKIKKLRRIAGGDTYTIIYLKMQLLSLKDEGNLYFEGIEDDFIEELALTIDEEVDNVKFTVMYLINQHLLEEVQKDEFSLPEAKIAIGTQSESTQRVRRLRERRKQEKALQCNGNVTGCNADETNCNTELELKTEIEIKPEPKKEPKPEQQEDKNLVGFFENSDQVKSSISNKDDILTVGSFKNLTISILQLKTLNDLYSEDVTKRFIDQLSIQVNYGKVKDVKSTFSLIKCWIEKALASGNTRLPDGYKSPYSKQPIKTPPKVCPKCHGELDSAGKCPRCHIATEYDPATKNWKWIQLVDTKNSILSDWRKKKIGVNANE